MLKISSDFLDYLLETQRASDREWGKPGDNTRLPPLGEMSKEMGISVASLREQLEVAKAIGLVEVHPRTGIRRLPYSFLPAVRQSLSFAISTDWSYFASFSDLRNHIEASYWDEAARNLTPEDHSELKKLVSQAFNKLNGKPIQIPHKEHRQLHLTIFSRLNNAFVLGLLEAYWEAYEAVGLNLYEDYKYLQQVWLYHRQMVDAIVASDFDAGYQALVQHRDLLFQRPASRVMDDQLVDPKER
jgi:DNA-binding FadR family transcriptional regulator